jgi:hypothetical protein
MIKRVVAIALVVPLLFSTSAPSFAAQVPKKKLDKAIPLVGLTEVELLNQTIDPTLGTPIRLFKSNSFTARVAVGEYFQLFVPGLWPKLVAAPVLISSSGKSANLTSSVPDLDGIVTLPIMKIMKKGNYVLLIRQPDEAKAVMAKIKVS